MRRRIERLEKLLDVIAGEPLRDDGGLTINDAAFLTELDYIKDENREMYVRFVLRYNEVTNSKLTEE